VVDRVIVVWNSNEIEPPPLPPQTYILRQKTNSLNNRWTKISESVRTEAILNLDDDVFINKAGIVCLCGLAQSSFATFSALQILLLNDASCSAAHKYHLSSFHLAQCPLTACLLLL